MIWSKASSAQAILIVHPDLAFKFFGATQSEKEKRFIDLFPDSEIAALVDNESVGLFSYAIIVDGKKIRMKDGCYGEIYNDFGDLLPEEKDLLSETIFMEEECPRNLLEVFAQPATIG